MGTMEEILPTILLVEDQPNDVLLLQRALQKAKVPNPVQVVGDGEDAIAYFSGTGPFADRKVHPFPRFVIMDVKMPKVSGLEVLEWLRAHPEYQVIPTLMLSSFAMDNDIIAAYKLGANSYIRKNSDPHEMARMIRKMYEYWMMCLRPKPGSGPTKPDGE